MAEEDKKPPQAAGYPSGNESLVDASASSQETASDNRPNTEDLNRTVFISDNLPFLRSLDNESIDLVVIDPPFGKKQTFTGKLRPELSDAELEHEYELLEGWGVQNEDDAYDIGIEFPDQSGTTARFSDIWDFRYQVEKTDWDRLKQQCPAAEMLIETTRHTHSASIAAYIAFMTLRMVEIHRVLKPTGSVYLHCDNEANAYLRQMMDAVFRPQNFRNEIVWNYGKWSNVSRYFQRNHDVILFYAKDTASDYTFNTPYVDKQRDVPYHTNIVKGEGQLLVYDAEETSAETVKRYRSKGYSIVNVQNEGVAENDTWTYLRDKNLNILNSRSKERTGYPTQKPQALARRIIEASSNPGDIVLDCFAGCAYVPVAAELAGRRWIACDMSPRAWTVVRRQFEKHPKLGIFTEGKRVSDKVEVKYWEWIKTRSNAVIRVHGPHDLPERKTKDEPYNLRKGANMVKRQRKIVFRTKPLENSRVIWNAFVKKWGSYCWYCGQLKPENRRELQLDHIEPNDGTNDDCWNRALACVPCNGDKSDELSVEETIDKALEEKRITRPVLRDEMMSKFKDRHQWAKKRWDDIKPKSTEQDQEKQPPSSG